MAILDLVARLGLAELARRAEITEATLKRWVRQGPSKAGAKVLAEILRRHRVSLRSAETRRRHAQERTGIAPPEESELSPDQVLPTRTPAETREVDAVKALEGIPPNRRGPTKKRIDSFFNDGEVRWIWIGRSVTEVDADEITDLSIEAWQNSGRDFLQVKFMFFRYIPFNPLYRGQMLRKQGKWLEWWAQTNAHSSIRAFGYNVEHVMDFAHKAAATRVVFLEMIGVSCFDHRDQLDLTKSLSN